MEKQVGSKKTGKYPSVKQVTDEQRIGIVKEIFATVTGRYDFLNHLLSLRRDVAWRRFTVKKMRFFDSNRLLDVATGTADLAIDAARRRPSIATTGLDFVGEMLRTGQSKIARRGLSGRISLVQGDALCLPFTDNTFDASSIAFGIRNIPDRPAALREMLRVVVPGGQVLVLEMTFIRNWFTTLMYRTYLNRILPVIAKIFSLNPRAYYYLADSIMNFPSPAAFVKLMEEAGMVEVKKHKLTLGITYLYVGRKPVRENG
jgi:demethylmenaquinone methyltransferase / 2-methoxy-6-polyprenyl-1,4-benzoquinol methylase